MFLEYAAGGELFDLIARKEKVKKFIIKINLNLKIALRR